jgi:hypothetical protein
LGSNVVSELLGLFEVVETLIGWRVLRSGIHVQ